jgi:hypothetical protein
MRRERAGDRLLKTTKSSALTVSFESALHGRVSEAPMGDLLFTTGKGRYTHVQFGVASIRTCAVDTTC